MDQDLAPRWNQESEEDINPGELAPKRTRFQQELVNLFRPRTEQPNETAADDVESSTKKSKKTPRGWRKLFAKIVDRDQLKEQESKADEDAPMLIDFLRHSRAEQPSEDEAEGLLRIDHKADEVVNTNFAEATTPPTPNESDPAISIVPEQIPEPQRVVHEHVDPLLLMRPTELKTKPVIDSVPRRSEHSKDSTGIFEKTSEFWRRRRNRQARRDVRKLKKTTKQDREIAVEREHKNTYEHSKLFEATQQLKTQVESLKGRQWQDRQLLHEAAAQRAEQQKELPILIESRQYEKPPEVPPPLFIEKVVEKTVSVETEKVTLAEKYSTPEEKREQLEARPIESPELNQAQKVESLSEIYFDRRHEVMDKSKEDQKESQHSAKKKNKAQSMGSASVATILSADKKQEHTPTGQKKSRTSNNTPPEVVTKDLYRQSIEYGVGTALLIVVLGIVSYAVR